MATEKLRTKHGIKLAKETMRRLLQCSRSLQISRMQNPKKSSRGHPTWPAGM
jgi:hypothetical protein